MIVEVLSLVGGHQEAESTELYISRSMASAIVGNARDDKGKIGMTKKQKTRRVFSQPTGAPMTTS